MMNLMVRLATIVVLALLARSPASADPVTIVAADKVKVSGIYYGDQDRAKPLILLFHQAGSNAGEYAAIAPRLNALGYNALAIDQRSGGSGWGRDNQTVKALRRNASFDEALPDLRAALEWALAEGRNHVLLLGSSYSAALVFLLAAERPDAVEAVLAFSPGEYLSQSDRVRRAASKVRVPVFVTSASDPAEIAEAGRIVQAAASAVKRHYEPRHGVHGASTLRADRNPAGVEENWTALQAFLAGTR